MGTYFGSLYSGFATVIFLKRNDPTEIKIRNFALHTIGFTLFAIGARQLGVSYLISMPGFTFGSLFAQALSKHKPFRLT